MNALVKHEQHAVQAPQQMSFAELERLATYVAASNLFGIKSKEQAIVLMSIAAAEGRHPVEAARDYNIIQGRPAKTAEAMLRDFQKSGGNVHYHQLSDTECDVTFRHPIGGTARIHWDMTRAKRAGLGTKDNWQKFPRQMLRARCISEGCRSVWPASTSGMYVPEEIRDQPRDIGGGSTAPETPAPEPTAEHSQIALRLDDAAAAGSATLKAEWESLTAPQRKQHKDQLSEWKAMAKAADAAADAEKTAEPDQQEPQSDGVPQGAHLPHVSEQA